MNPPRCQPEDYIQFVLATPKVYTATEAGRVTPHDPLAPAHDAYTRLLNRLEPDPEPLWNEIQPVVRKDDGILVLDDSVLDKHFARHMGLVGYHWSGRHKRIVRGIDLVTLLWTDGDGLWPCDYRLVNPVESTTKNDLFRELIRVAHQRGFRPRCVVFDTWYSGKENLKCVRDCGWTFLTQVRCNRKVNPDNTGNRPIRECDIAAGGTIVHLEGFGLVRAFRIVTRDGGTEYWITNDLSMGECVRLSLSEQAWGIEEYHRGLKQHCGVDRCQARAPCAQRNHVGFSIRAFVRLEWHRFHTGISWFEAKMQIVRDAVRSYLAKPKLTLPKAATA